MSAWQQGPVRDRNRDTGHRWIYLEEQWKHPCTWWRSSSCLVKKLNFLAVPQEFPSACEYPGEHNAAGLIKATLKTIKKQQKLRPHWNRSGLRKKNKALKSKAIVVKPWWSQWGWLDSWLLHTPWNNTHKYHLVENGFRREEAIPIKVGVVISTCRNQRTPNFVKSRRQWAVRWCGLWKLELLHL